MAWTQYAQMVRTSGMERDYIPCLSFQLRLAGTLHFRPVP